MFLVARITLVFLFLNILLFASKLWVGLSFDSLAVLSDAFNSLVDIATSVMIYFAVRVASKPADEDHQFGYSRAEPIAAFTVSILTFVLAFEVVRESVQRMLSGTQPEAGWLPIITLLAVIVIKGGMFLVARRFKENPALVALAADAKMDVVISCLALLGVWGVLLDYPQLDTYAALLIAVWIAWIGFTLARDNLAKLMGRCPDESTVKKIRTRLSKLKQAKRIVAFHDLRVQFIGSEIQVMVHINLAKNLSLEKAHACEKEVQKALKSVKGVAEVAVHVDPV